MSDRNFFNTNSTRLAHLLPKPEIGHSWPLRELILRDQLRSMCRVALMLSCLRLLPLLRGKVSVVHMIFLTEIYNYTGFLCFRFVSLLC